VRASIPAKGWLQQPNPTPDQQLTLLPPPLIRPRHEYDRLDRCRPSFALDLLEKVKHFFAVPGVTFVLVGSLQQLESATRFAYGEIDARTYLEKFYHLRVMLPSDDRNRPDRAVTAKYLQYLFPGPNGRNYIAVIYQFCRIHPLSLRTLERVVAYTKIGSISIPKNSLHLPQVVAVLCILKVLEPDLYAAARNGKLRFNELNRFIRFQDWRDENEPEKQHRLAEDATIFWSYSLGELEDPKKAEIERGQLAIYGIRDPLQIVPHFSQMIDGFLFPETNNT